MFPINTDEENAIISGYCGYVAKILDGIHVSYDQDTLYMFVRNSFPDMRSILNSLQSMYTQDVKTLDRAALIKSFDCSELLNIIINGNDPVENYKFVAANYATNPDDAMMSISKTIVDFIRLNYPQFAPKIPYIITTVAEYMAQLPTSPDRMLVLLACVFKLQMIIKS